MSEKAHFFFNSVLVVVITFSYTVYHFVTNIHDNKDGRVYI